LGFRHDRYRQRGWLFPLFEQKVLTDANYEALTHLILSQTSLIDRPLGRTISLRWPTSRRLRIAQAPPETWEYQMIYGMAEPFQHAVTQHGVGWRLYTPVGDLLPGWPICTALLENTSNESFLRKEYVESSL